MVLTARSLNSCDGLHAPRGPLSGGDDGDSPGPVELGWAVGVAGEGAGGGGDGGVAGVPGGAGGGDGTAGRRVLVAGQDVWVVHNALTLTAAGVYRPFGQIAAACLPVVAARHGRSAPADRQRELADRIRALPAHPDAAGALRRLRDAGFGVVTLTNSVADVAEDQLRNAGLRDLVDAV